LKNHFSLFKIFYDTGIEGYLQEFKMIHIQLVAIKMAINETNLVEMVILQMIL